MRQKIKHFLFSTKFKITFGYSLIFFILEILFGVLIYFSLYNNLASNLDESLKTEAGTIDKILAQNKIDFENFSPDSDYSSPEDFLWDLIYDELAYTPRNNYIQIKYKNRIIFKTVNLGNEQFTVGKFFTSPKTFNYKNLDLLSNDLRAVVFNDGNYQIIIASNKDQINQTLSSLLNIYFFLAPIFLVISIIGGMFLSAKSLSRIDKIIRETEEITAHNLTKKIEGEEFNDEYGRLVKKMNEMISRIKTSIGYMNHFSVSAAHELKTPLTILRGETEIALKSHKAPEQYIEVLKSNYEEILRLIKIVDNLFFISKVDNAIVVLNKEEVEFDKYLIGIVNSLKILGEEKNINIIVKSDISAKIEIDKELMKQAISNLIDNAIKYGKENEDIIFEVSKENGRIFFRIINKGEGIPKESLPKIFDRFYRVESSRNRKLGGAGLGLAVVNAIVKWHNAEITVKSEENKETEFKVIFENGKA
ncbi:MAG: ATP-binding protein [Ignavibacteriaceae bacterium]